MTIRPQKWSGIYGGICVLIDPSFAEQQSSEAQGKGRAKGRPWKVTQRSFIDDGWWILYTITGTSFDAAESGPPPLHSVRCPDHFCLESFPQELKVRRSKMH